MNNLFERVLVYLFANQYCESDYAYFILLLILAYLTFTFVEGIIPETAETIYQSELINPVDPSQRRSQS